MQRRLVWMGLIGLSVALVVSGWAEPRFGRTYRIPDLEGMGTQVVAAVPVGQRYLAVLYQRAFGNESDRWIQVYGSPQRYALAWMNSSWQLLQRGEWLYAAIVGPVNRIVLRDPGKRVYMDEGWPKIAVRDAFAEDCPFLFVRAFEIRCVGQDLVFQKAIRLPFQIRGVIVDQGQVYLKGIHRGFLLHRLDLRTGRVVETRWPLSRIRQDLQKAGFSESVLRFLHATPLVTRTDRVVQAASRIAPPGLQQRPPEEALHLARVAREYVAFDIVKADPTYAFMLLERPPVLLKIRWTDGQVMSIVRVQRDDLPEEAHQFRELYMVGLYPVGSGLQGVFVLVRPLTYQEYVLGLVEAGLAESAKLGESLRPDEIVGEESRYLIISFRSDGRPVRSVLLPTFYRDSFRFFPVRKYFQAGGEFYALTIDYFAARRGNSTWYVFHVNPGLQ